MTDILNEPVVQASALTVDNLSVSAATLHGVADVVDQVSLNIQKGQISALAGESGSGKTVTSLALMRLHDDQSLRIKKGNVSVDGLDVLGVSEGKMESIRGDSISMVFQDPMNSIDPVYTVGSSIVEVIQAHSKVSKREAKKRAEKLFERVGIPDARNRLSAYPFELSGGLLQRVMIAMAIANDPDVLIADEPTTALDVTVQKKIMSLLRDLADEGMAILLVTHDLAVVSEYADVINVMYAGQIVETGPVQEVLSSPKHPYTSGLIGAIPDVTKRQARLSTIPGRVPLPHEFPQGCRFLDRCPHAQELCKPPVNVETINEERNVRCVRQAELNLKGV